MAALPGLVGIVLAGFAGAYSFARLAETARPDLALALMPGLPSAMTTKVDQLIAESADGYDRSKLAEARKMALTSLRSEALNPGALRTLAATAPHNLKNAPRLIATSLAISRRDVGTQLLQIEIDVARNNIDAVLRHYDQALSVKPSVGPVLFPIMITATEDPGALAAIRRAVSKGPDWLPNLVEWANANPAYLAGLTRILSAIPQRSAAMAPGYGQAIVETLVSEKEYGPAFTAYHAYAGSDGNNAFSGGFLYKPLDWRLEDNFDYGAELVEQKQPFVRIYADPKSDGVAMSRLVSLPAGKYALELVLDPLPDSGSGKINVSVSCITDQDRGMYRSELPIQRMERRLSFSIPSGCRYQWIRMGVAAADAPVEANLRRAALSRLD
ncbi:MAG TPA: hypothetical protein VFT61_08990 [Sphingomicrobium sp.]|nr:hypothetical protein [Sphingomicrobium sp.]